MADRKRLPKQLAPIALFLVLCYNELNSSTSIWRSLSESNTNKESMSRSDIYWYMSCPLEVSGFSIASLDSGWLDNPEYQKSAIAETKESFTERAIAAREFSLNAKTRPRVFDALNSRAFIARKVVFAGDSLTRQQYISMGCLAGDQIERHVTPFVPDRTNGIFFDGRFEWRIGGEVFYAPTAGKIYKYNWDAPPNGPIVGGEEAWLDSCQNDLPFQFDTYSYGLNEDGSRPMERITLGSGDVVFLNAGFHFFRDDGHANLLALLQCMEEKGKEKFPHLVYITSSLQHFDITHTLTNEAGDRIKKCTNEVQENLSLIDDLRMYKDKIPIIGNHIDLTNKGDLHVVGEKTDCTHWFQPGMPDLFAATAAETVVKISEGVDLMQKDEAPVVRQDETVNKEMPQEDETAMAMQQGEEGTIAEGTEGSVAVESDIVLQKEDESLAAMA